jgi:hypothetical protein
MSGKLPLFIAVVVGVNVDEIPSDDELASLTADDRHALDDRACCCSTGSTSARCRDGALGVSIQRLQGVQLQVAKIARAS